jgi:hypothetical protein
MAIRKTKQLKKGQWQTLESGWNRNFWVSFYQPQGVRVKVRYGGKWLAGWNSQQKTLDGLHINYVKVNRCSIVYARVRACATEDIEVSYTCYEGVFSGLPA